MVEPHLAAMLRSDRMPNPLAGLMRIYPDRGGKLLRPVICLATAEALGIEPRRVARFAAALELLHNGFLIHDDFEDGSHLRRGEETLHRMLGPALAVHIGDALLLRAFSSAFFAAASSPSGVAAVAELQRASATTEEGQAMDLLARERELDHITRQEYFAIVLKKTAAYTTLLPMRVSAAFAGVTDGGILGNLSRFALYCGLGFQIQDDLRSYGSSNLNGKSSAEDLLEGKITLPLIRFFEIADTDAKARARAFFAVNRMERDPVEAGWLASRIVASGGIHHSREVAYVAAAKARHAWFQLERQLVPSSGSALLAALPEMMITHR